MFYQNNLKHRKLREIVEELQTEEESEIGNVNGYALNKKDIQTNKMTHASHRKKGATMHSKYQQTQVQQRRKVTHGGHQFFNTDSNNTIVELTNDFSSSGKNKVNNSQLTSK